MKGLYGAVYDGYTKAGNGWVNDSLLRGFAWMLMDLIIPHPSLSEQNLLMYICVLCILLKYIGQHSYMYVFSQLRSTHSHSRVASIFHFP